MEHKNETTMEINNENNEPQQWKTTMEYKNEKLQ